MDWCFPTSKPLYWLFSIQFIFVRLGIWFLLVPITLPSAREEISIYLSKGHTLHAPFALENLSQSLVFTTLIKSFVSCVIPLYCLYWTVVISNLYYKSAFLWLCLLCFSPSSIFFVAFLHFYLFWFYLTFLSVIGFFCYVFWAQPHYSNSGSTLDLRSN